MKIFVLNIIIIFISVNFFNRAFGQVPGVGEEKPIAFETGFQLGNLLPDQVDGVTEIMPLWGLKAGFKLNDAFVEGGLNAGNAKGAEWANLHVSLRGEIPVEELIGIVYIGADATQFKGVDKETKIFGGGHVGGGILSKISPTVWLRVDMKFNVNPGTSLFIGVGFTLRFPEEGGSGAS